ncbi:hypothetical protein CHLNCDRAFT_56897 [Chlorella variabilis]|uniref:Uncharacterized protein n=1 Tax=Chlorella variabilis TaxID=554065 RepID=E1Z5R1_CHLVA|nr:hypothetical protein CHLNCDRAFT_56897 [Chlorella variabilis]EFN58519.1 hypothetical protein CHLNCDRAFT_56897 [Chlorella variabilis]|eukprot:XP_005850621.1 hypothetical protein CHLNCDRAFT_56897 [Chlorella variabilis]
MAASAACSFSGRAQTPFSQPGRTRRRQLRATPSIRSSLEEEFKKQCLGRTNGTSSSSNQERLKDLSASHFGGGDRAAAGNGASLQPPAADGSSSNNCDEAAPFTANLPLSGEPYHPLEFYPTSQIDLDWGSAATPDEPWAGGAERSRCFVILFGVGRAETEGIYSLRAVAKDDGLPVDTIVAFENEDDALRYSTLLEATMDHEPTVWPIEWGELLEFCNSAGYRCRLEPSGSLLIPPDYNVGMTDWEKSLRLRKGEFSVLGNEPAPRQAGEGFFLDGPNWVFESAPIMQDDEEVHTEHLNAVIDSQLSSPAALEAMKASLERLLPQE